MLHWYCKVKIILRKRKNTKETIIVRWREYRISNCHNIPQVTAVRTTTVYS